MLIIFAKLTTDEKCAVWCLPSQRGQIIKRLNEEFGGYWLCVDEVLTSGEILKFNDGLVYNGFEADDKKRYSPSIVRFRLNAI